MKLTFKMFTPLSCLCWLFCILLVPTIAETSNKTDEKYDIRENFTLLEKTLGNSPNHSQDQIQDDITVQHASSGEKDEENGKSGHSARNKSQMSGEDKGDPENRRKTGQLVSDTKNAGKEVVQEGQRPEMLDTKDGKRDLEQKMSDRLKDTETVGKTTRPSDEIANHKNPQNNMSLTSSSGQTEDGSLNTNISSDQRENRNAQDGNFAKRISSDQKGKLTEIGDRSKDNAKTGKIDNMRGNLKNTLGAENNEIADEVKNPTHDDHNVTEGTGETKREALKIKEAKLDSETFEETQDSRSVIQEKPIGEELKEEGDVREDIGELDEPINGENNRDGGVTVSSDESVREGDKVTEASDEIKEMEETIKHKKSGESMDESETTDFYEHDYYESESFDESLTTYEQKKELKNLKDKEDMNETTNGEGKEHVDERGRLNKTSPTEMETADKVGESITEDIEYTYITNGGNYSLWNKNKTIEADEMSGFTTPEGGYTRGEVSDDKDNQEMPGTLNVTDYITEYRNTSDINDTQRGTNGEMGDLIDDPDNLKEAQPGESDLNTTITDDVNKRRTDNKYKEVMDKFHTRSSNLSEDIADTSEGEETEPVATNNTELSAVDSSWVNVTDDLIAELPDEPDEELKNDAENMEEDWNGKNFTWTESPMPEDVDLEQVVADLSAKISWFKYVGNATLRCADLAKQQDTLMTAIEELHGCLEKNYQACASEYAKETGCVAPAFHEDACGHLRMGFRDLRMYLPSQECWWTLIVPSQFMVNLTFDEFYMEDSGPECFYDYMISFDGPSTSHPSFGKFCGRRLKFTLYGTSNIMLVHAKTDSSVGKVGFRAAYQVMDPNKGLTLQNASILTEPEGEFVISELPPTILDTYVRAWYYTTVYIRAEYGSKISLVIQFAMDGEDYLTLHDGPLETNKPIVNLTSVYKARSTHTLWSSSFLASLILRRSHLTTKTWATVDYQMQSIDYLNASHSPQCKGNSSIHLDPELGGHWISLKPSAVPYRKRPISCYWTFTTEPGYSVMVNVNEYIPNGPNNDECFHEGLLIVNDEKFREDAQKIGPFCDSELYGLFGGAYSVFHQYMSPGSSVTIMFYSFLTYPSSTAKQRGPFKAFVKASQCRGVVQLCSSPLPQAEENVFRLVPRGHGDVVQMDFYCNKAACCVLQQFPVYKPLVYKVCNITIQTEGSKLIATSVFELYTAISDKPHSRLEYMCQVHSMGDVVAKGRADRGYQCLGSKMFLVLSDYSPYVTASFSLKVSEKRCGYFHPEIHDTSEYYPPCALAEFPAIYPATYKLYFIDPFYKEDRYFSFFFSMMGNCVQQCFNDRIEFHDRHGEFIWDQLPRLPFRWNSWSSSSGNWSRTLVLARNWPGCLADPLLIRRHCGLQVHFKQHSIPPDVKDPVELRCPAGFSLSERSCYKVAESHSHVSGIPYTESDSVSHTEGRRLCIETGGDLVSINSQKEMAAIQKFLFQRAWKKYLQYTPGTKVIFIGLQTNTKDKSKRWVSGQPLTYMEWNNPVYNTKRPTHFRYSHPTARVQPSVSSEIIREELKHLQPSVTKGYQCVAMVIDNPFDQTRWVKIPCGVRIPGAVPVCEVSPVNMSLPYSEGQFGENTSRSYEFMEEASTISTVYTTRIIPQNKLHQLVMAEKMCLSPFVNLGTKCIAITVSPNKTYVEMGSPEYECKRGEYNRLLQDHHTNIRSHSLQLRGAIFNREEVKLLKLMLPSLMQRFEAGKIRISKSLKERESLDNRDCYILSPSWSKKANKHIWKMIALEHHDDEYRKCNGKEPYEGDHKDLYNYICEVNPIPFSSVCEKHHYKCGDGTCILIHNKCDGTADCLDGDDEAKCGNVCNSTLTDLSLPIAVCFSESCSPELCRCSDQYFQCLSGGCIPISKVCNFYNDCKDGSDEMACSRGRCKEKEFTCESGQCVPLHLYCDFVNNCVDGSDETGCGFESGCPRRLRTDASIQNCTSEDNCVLAQEEGEMTRQKQLSEMLRKSYKRRYYTCPDQTCVHARSEGDFIPDCPAQGQTNVSLDHYSVQDEIEYLTTYGHYWVSEEGEPYLLPSDSICHMYKVSCNLHVKRCFYRNESCVFDLDPRHQLVGCRDAAHLQNCKDRQCGHMFKCPNSYCLPIRRVCDGFYDCENGEDEVNCDTYYCPGMFRCKNEKQCIPQTEVCDGVINCHLSGEDEEMCELRNKDCPTRCQCYGHYANCSHVEPDVSSVDKVIKKLDTGTKALILRHNSLNHIPKLIKQFYKLHRLDISHNAITTLDEIFDDLEVLVELHLAYNRITTLSKPFFKKLHNLRVLNLKRNAISHMSVDCFIGLHSLPVLDLSFQQLRKIQSFQFSGLRNLKQLLLYGNYIDNIQANAFSRKDGEKTEPVTIATLEVLNLAQNPISVSEKQAFKLLPVGVNLTADRHKFCCFASHVPNCYPQADEFSSCSQMIANKVLRVVLWGIGLLAFIGNLIVLQQRMKHEKETPPSLLVQHLSFSDLLMGAYLLIIAGADQYFKDHYIDYTDQWRVHALCKLSGFLSMLSCQMSAFLTMLITVDRLLACVPLFGGQSLLLRTTRGLIAIGWTLSAVVSVIPILEFPYFGSQGYVRSGVCTTFNIIKGKVSGWEYSMAVFVVFNSICYVISGLGYSLVYVMVVRGVEIWEKYIPEELDEEEKENELIFRNNERVISQRLVAVVMTNFLVWTALISVSVFTLLDYTLHPMVSAWLTLIVVPLNAAINPFLYALSTQPYRILDDDLLANWIGETEELAEGEEDKADTEMADSSYASSQSFRKAKDGDVEVESHAKDTARAREAVIKELL